MAEKSGQAAETESAAAGSARLVGVSVARVDETMFDDGVRWLRRSDARRRCGVGRDILDAWVSDGKVEAHKLHPGRNGTVVFSAPDIDRAIREAPAYVPAADADGAADGDGADGGAERRLRGAAGF